MDTAFLGTWIQSQHLDPEALRAYHQAFESHPSRLLVMRRFLIDAVAARLSKFLAAEAEFRTEYGLYSVDQGVTEEEWLAAEPADRFFRFGKLVGTPAQFQLSPNALTYIRFRQAFQDPRLKTFFEEITGLPLGASRDFGSHAMKGGDFLLAHSDDNRNRRLALVIYLSPDWDPAFGGALHMRDASGGVTRIEPEYNSIVAFDVKVDTTHYVPMIEPAVGERVRLTIGGWYHQPE
ncbi:MAG TPA: 2OG-Fe(II) oxygenase family protein [bacterium]|nr:2OG-Fe(II) oxygenase family protein [bacterium]